MKIENFSDLRYTKDMLKPRPWGYYKVLDKGEGYQVKHIFVIAGKRLSYQSHLHRSEHWYIVHGNAKITIEGKEQTLHPGSYLSISPTVKHRIEALDEDVLFIEIQTGTYFGEDDIERFDDDYGRV